MAAKSNTTTTSKTRDPLVELGRKIHAAYKRSEQLEGIESATGKKWTAYSETESWDLDEDILAYRAMLSTMEASSIEGAIIQLAEANRLADELHDQTSLVEAEGFSEHECKKIFRKIHKLTWSAVRFLRNNPQFDLSSIGVYNLLNDYQDPWVPYEKHVAVLENEPG